jgi:hypothetical protein
MKRDFQDGPDHRNTEPYPNPKPLTVERVSVRIERTDDNGNTTYGPVEAGYVVNAKVHPAAFTGRR